MTRRSFASIRPINLVRLTGTLGVALLLVGAGLRIEQYRANPALILDEVAIARNVIDRSVGDLLTKPLDYEQTAPKGFLLAEKLATLVLGPTDSALRIVPLAFSLLALVGFWFLARRVLDESTALIALASFAAAAPLLRCSSEVKQYSADVAMSVLLLSMALLEPATFASRRGAVVIGVVGALAVWFSQPAVLIVAAVCAITMLRLLGRHEQGRRDARCVVPVFACWGVSAVGAAFAAVASMTPTTREYMQRFWEAGFMPLSLAGEVQIWWPLDQLQFFFGEPGPGDTAGLSYPLAGLYLALGIVGLGWLGWRSWKGGMIATPILVALAAAILHEYPFKDRLILFLLPSFLLGIAASVGALQGRVRAVSPSAANAVGLLLLAPTIYPVARVPPPYSTEDVKPALARVQSSWQDGDPVYVYYGGAGAVQFYAARYGLPRGAYEIGGCYRGEGRHYLEELDAYRGRPRLWVIVAHAIPRFREREDILGYLDAIGSRRDAFTVRARSVGRPGLPAEVYLYDLSDETRLDRATAASFPLTGPASRDTRLGCGEGPQAMSAQRDSKFSQ